MTDQPQQQKKYSLSVGNVSAEAPNADECIRLFDHGRGVKQHHKIDEAIR